MIFRIRLLKQLLVAISLLISTLTLGADLKKLTLVTLEFPPLEYRNSDGVPEGIAVDIVKKVLGNLGYEVEINIYPWTRAIGFVKEGKAHAIFTAYKNPEREKFLDFGSEVLIEQKISFYAQTGSKFVFKDDFTQLKNMSIGTLNTVSYGIEFDTAKLAIPLNTQRVEKLDLSFKKLAAGRLDLVISNEFSASDTIKDLKLEPKIIKVPNTVETTPS